ncbi:MAG: hypothetical protein EBX41_09150 [Chitinophagia bacterium]|nr:hypothetical protein [Chitinophagia bacterium]
MVAVPAATANTNPVVGLTVTTPVLLLLQVPPETVDENVAVVPAHRFCVPVIVPAEMEAVTVMSTLAVAFAHPEAPVTVYVRVV